MKRKFCIYEFVVGLVCLISILAFQPPAAQSSTAVLDEVERPVPHEDVKSIDTSAQQDLSSPTEKSKDEQTASPDTTPSEDSDNLSTPTDGEKDIKEETLDDAESIEEPAKEESPEHTTVREPNKTSSLEKVKPAEKKAHKFSISKIFEKCRNVMRRFAFCNVFHIKNQNTQHTAVKPLFGRFHKAEHSKTTDIQTEYPEVVPYYFINPTTTLENYKIENIVGKNKLDSPIELMPCHLAIESLMVKSDNSKKIIPPRGTTEYDVLVSAPSPQITVTGKTMSAKLVIDIRNNALYKYDKKGFPLKAYSVATGAYGTRTLPGLRIVTYKERFPYSGAPNSKRALDPYSYGPYILFLNKVDPKTGRQCVMEQLLHGNGNEYSIGRKVSHGCIRTNNKVMREELSKEVVRGDYILLINPDIN